MGGELSGCCGVMGVGVTGVGGVIAAGGIDGSGMGPRPGPAGTGAGCPGLSDGGDDMSGEKPPGSPSLCAARPPQASSNATPTRIRLMTEA